MRFLPQLLVVLVLATGCAGATEPAAQESPKGPIAGPNCADSTGNAKHVTFGPSKLVGIVLGSGSTGIVLAHQNGGSVCQWLDNAVELAEKGYRVLAFDFSGFGGSPGGSPGRSDDVTTAVKAIRAEGVSKVVLMGASMGGTAVIEAAASITPPVQAVVSLSAPGVFSGADAVSAAPKLTMPVLYVSGAGESTYVMAAEKMHQSSKASPDAQLLIAPGTGAHGVALIPSSKEATDGVNAFLAKHAPAR
ncbi:alpha/beta hydrolase [Allorhizocola rhizosphaerae]|uniref:alpha/beta hydrolase n=1 Tax=Allorhizocola rhizosphaerae TaxID=1872709 RepID=UPI000E3CC14C|nr:alpha/beta fold hydrolase [Allorhizocola rhizosphaerae]